MSPTSTFVVTPLYRRDLPIFPAPQTGVVIVPVNPFPLVSFVVDPVPSSKSHLPTGALHVSAAPGTQYSADAEFEATDPPVNCDVSDIAPKTKFLPWL